MSKKYDVEVAEDPFATYPTEQVRADRLAEGMVLVDPDLGTAVWALDHRLPTVPRSGSVTWLVEDLERGGWHEASFGRKAMIPVAVR